MKSPRYLRLFIFVILNLYSYYSVALPTPTSAYNATSAATDSPSAELKLYKLCAGNLENTDLLTTEAMMEAAVKALKRASANNAPLTIDRCIIKTPVKGSYLDETIAGFNAKKTWEDTANTVFLLVAVGMKSETIKAGEDCSSKKPVIAGKQDGKASALPSGWLDQFQIKKTIKLKAGQKLIGVPMNSSSGSFAEGYFVGLQRKIEPRHFCSDYGTYRRSTFYKGELIHFSGTGILVTGITTLPALTNAYQDTFSQRDHCQFSRGKTKIRASSHHVHTEMLKGELNFKSLDVPVNGFMVNISGNEFFQILQPAIKISLAEESKEVDSRLFSDRTLVGFSNNQVYSCYKGQIEKAVDIDIAYQDLSPQPAFIQALEFKDNQLLGDTPQALSLVLPEHVKADITSSQFITIKKGARSKGISIAGPSQSSENWQNPLTATITGNTIKGYEAALSLTGYQKLVLKSNQLLGDRVSIERRDDLTLPVTLAGDSINQFKSGDHHPCYQLEDTNIIGGFVFSDEKTSCPKGFAAPTVQPPELITPSFTTPVSQRTHQNNGTSTIALGSTPAMTTNTHSRLPDTTTRGILDSRSKGDAAKTSYTEPKPTISTPIQPSGSQILPGSSKSRDSSFITPSSTSRRSSSTPEGSHLSHHSDSSHSAGMSVSPTRQSLQTLKTARTTTLVLSSSRHNSDSFIPGTTSRSHLSLKSTRGSTHKSFPDSPEFSYSSSTVQQVSSTKGFTPHSTPARKQPGISQSLVTKTLPAPSAPTGYDQLAKNKESEGSAGMNEWQITLTAWAALVFLAGGILLCMKCKQRHSAISGFREVEEVPLHNVE